MPQQEKLTPEEMKARFTPSHLLEAEGEEGLKEATEKAMAPAAAEKAVDPSDDPRSRNPYTFQLDWTDTRGKKWQGSFTVHYPTPMDLMRAGVMQARMNGSTPRDALDPLTDEIAFIVSRLSYCLDKRPTWFKDPTAIIDGVPLLQAVYERVLDFEQFFREHGQIASPS